jgi:hypothetical protein
MSGEVDNIKFVLTPSAMINKPFIHSEGGSVEVPVTVRSNTFTVVSGSLGSLSYSILEVVDGTTLIIGCTFSDFKMNPVADNGVIVVKNAAMTMKNSIFSNVSLETNAEILGSGKSECEWGTYSVIVLNEAVTLIKDTVMSNTFSGIVVHGGTVAVEGTNFTVVGTQGNSKYPSVERHLRCGLLLSFYIYFITYMLIIVGKFCFLHFHCRWKCYCKYEHTSYS